MSTLLQFSEEKSVICSTCRIQFANVMDYKMHISSEYHIYNTKRRIASLDPISEEIFDQKKATLTVQSQCQSQLTEVYWKCQPCKKTFKTMEQLDQHKFSKNHKKNEKAYKLANPEASESSLFQNITTDKPLLAHLLGSHEVSHNDSQDPTKEHQAQQDDESKDSSKVPQRTSLDSLRICLFCNKECEGVKKCIDHMRLKHSFFILDIDCVTSLKGLLTYVAERIQLGYLCLFCNQMFKNSRRCQQHMMDKSHCFFNMADEHEYERFYDFSKTYEGHPDADQELKTKQPSKEGKHEGSDQLGDDWEDVDFEDAAEDEASNKGEENKQSSSAQNKTESEAEFSIITDSNAHSENPSQPFTAINHASSSHNGEKNPFQNICADSISSIQDDKTKKKGMTREEAMLGLKIKPAQLLETGEVLLGNGKIIGTRSLKFIYKQRFRLPDSRESVMLNKISLEYRKLRALTYGKEEQLWTGHACNQIAYSQIIIRNKEEREQLNMQIRAGKKILRPQI